jgi:hypothetical protein
MKKRLCQEGEERGPHAIQHRSKLGLQHEDQQEQWEEQPLQPLVLCPKTGQKEWFSRYYGLSRNDTAAEAKEILESRMGGNKTRETPS